MSKHQPYLEFEVNIIYENIQFSRPDNNGENDKKGKNEKIENKKENYLTEMEFLNVFSGPVLLNPSVSIFDVILEMIDNVYFSKIEK
jgi:hypothetical protein